MSEIDDDLKSLLEELDGHTELKSDATNINDASETTPIEQSNLIEALRPVEQNLSITTDKSEPDTPEINISKYLDKMESVADEVLQACRSDRQEAQEMINMLRNQCDLAHDKNVPPARMYVDGLVKSVEVKANINTNAVKVMEGVAKMIAATKAGLNINNNNVSVSSAELDEILSSTEIIGELD